VAKYQQDRFAEAAKAFVKANKGNIPVPTDTGAIRSAAASLAASLPANDPAVPGLLAVGGSATVQPLRASIARRFISISVYGLVGKPAPAKTTTAKAAPAKAAKAKATPKNVAANGTRTTRKAAPMASDAEPVAASA
jgi:hypothetical protein